MRLNFVGHTSYAWQFASESRKLQAGIKKNGCGIRHPKYGCFKNGCCKAATV